MIALCVVTTRTVMASWDCGIKMHGIHSTFTARTVDTTSCVLTTSQRTPTTTVTRLLRLCNKQPRSLSESQERMKASGVRDTLVGLSRCTARGKTTLTKERGRRRPTIRRRKAHLQFFAESRTRRETVPQYPCTAGSFHVFTGFGLDSSLEEIAR